MIQAGKTDLTTEQIIDLKKESLRAAVNMRPSSPYITNTSLGQPSPSVPYYDLVKEASKIYDWLTDKF